MEYRYHPIIEGLKANENGTEVLLKGVLLAQFENEPARKNPTLKVNFNNKAHSVTRIVCECWNGLRQHSGQRVSKIDQLSNNHYSNLEWKEGAANGVSCFVQKIKPDDITEILELLKGNAKITEIATMYNVNRSTITRIQQKYGENK